MRHKISKSSNQYYRLLASNSYFEAARYLEKMLSQSAKMGDKNRWLPYLASLREQNRRKRNFIKILDAIGQGKKLTGNVFP